MTLLDRLALAHQKHEGWFPGSVSQRNNNPGNLRLTKHQEVLFGATAGVNGFARFPDYRTGFLALKSDIRAKITGHSAHIDYSRNPTFLDYVKVYAPAEDGNNPHSYATALIADLSHFGIRLDTPLARLAPSLDSTEPVKPVPTLRFLTKSVLLRLANRLPEGVRRRLLARLSVPPTL